MQQIRIEYDDDALTIIDKVNEALKEENLLERVEFKDDGLSHDGYCIFKLEHVKCKSICECDHYYESHDEGTGPCDHCECVSFRN